MTASVVISIIALTVTLIMGVSVTVLVSRALSNAFRTVESMHTRMQEANDKTLDRLMTIRWEDFIAMQTFEEVEEGGFFVPGEDETEGPSAPSPSSGGVEGSRWGELSVLRSHQEALENEERLLAEDFPEERSETS